MSDKEETKKEVLTEDSVERDLDSDKEKELIDSKKKYASLSDASEKLIEKLSDDNLNKEDIAHVNEILKEVKVFAEAVKAVSDSNKKLFSTLGDILVRAEVERAKEAKKAAKAVEKATAKVSTDSDDSDDDNDDDDDDDTTGGGFFGGGKRKKTKKKRRVRKKRRRSRKKKTKH